MLVELDGSSYFLAVKTTGDDYLYVRTHSVVLPEPKLALADEAVAEAGQAPVVAAVASTIPVVSDTLYEHANLVVRLRIDGKRVSDRAVRDLPRPHYQTLVTVAIQLDNEEAGVSADFLSIAFSIFPQFKSLWETSLIETALGSAESTDKPSE